MTRHPLQAPSIKRRLLLRRVGIVCCHFLRNLAFYTAGWRNGKLIFQDPFWVNVNGNFFDICVLEWYKLFGDKGGKHYWRNVITNQALFSDGLLRAAKLTETEFEAYIKEMRTYRDKFVAHLDAEPIMRLPNLIVARDSASFLYDYLLANEELDLCFHDAPAMASTFYERFSLQGTRVYCG